ncbi:hypothetical protein SAMN05880582_101784 [Rhizobium sp. RU20A]|uniref:hypothetical protein n=1 Tax=Rhizobium sp. RU20A TaxID=1907412 RepID=UPI000956BBBE|nr:hypothetical protein [Rhizobium sp. RU20A]SIQ11326.1 hypothetical protein SAMN05880582_101784 [Rhizobium sp. RU20A]
MKTALIVMTILGCDDSVTQCHYVATVERSFTSISECDSRSESEIATHQDKNYPVIVAVCETPDADTASIAGDAGAGKTATAPATTGEAPLAEGETIPVPPEGSQAATANVLQDGAPLTPEGQQTPEGQKPLPRRALDMITGVLPSRDQLKSVVTTPVHTLEDGYSWVARRFSGQ